MKWDDFAANVDAGIELIVLTFAVVMMAPLCLIGMAFTHLKRRYPASADTHPKGGDGEAAPFMSGAVAKPDAQPQPRGNPDK